MKNQETFFEALTNPNSNFRQEMNSWWGEYINNKETNINSRNIINILFENNAIKANAYL